MPTTPFDDELPQNDPEPQPPVPEPQAARRRAVAHVRPISIADIVRDAAGSDPMRVVRDFEQISKRFEMDQIIIK